MVFAKRSSQAGLRREALGLRCVLVGRRRDGLYIGRTLTQLCRWRLTRGQRELCGLGFRFDLLAIKLADFLIGRAVACHRLAEQIHRLRHSGRLQVGFVDRQDRGHIHRLRLVGIDQLGQTEVEQLDAAIGR